MRMVRPIRNTYGPLALCAYPLSRRHAWPACSTRCATATGSPASRLRLWALAVLVASAAGLVYLVATSDGLNDYQGRPLGTDFSNIYAAGTYVLDGQPGGAVRSAPAQHAREQADLRRRHAVLRLALSAVLPVRSPAVLALLPYRAGAGGRGRRRRCCSICWRSRRGCDACAASASARDARVKPRDAGRARCGCSLALAFPAVFVNSATATTAFSPRR